MEIVADRGIDAKVELKEWNKVCRRSEAAFRNADLEGGVISGLQTVTRHLLKHLSSDSLDTNELPNEPVVL